MSDNDVTVRDGVEMDVKQAAEVYADLQSLCNTDAIAFYELAMICRHPEHELFGDALATLIRRGFVQESGQPREEVWRIVKNAVIGEGFSMTLRNPVGGAG